MADPRNILSVTPKGYTPTTVAFSDGDFEDEIKSHGRVVEVETALRCPCTAKTTGNNLISCQNCFGSGWVFVDRRRTVALIQSINQTNSKFKEYNLALAGHMSVSMGAKDKLSYMDIIRMTEHTVGHSELLRIRRSRSDNSFYAIASFEIEEVEQAFLFVEANEPLLKLRKGVHFNVTRNKMTILDESIVSDDSNPVDKDGFTNQTISIRYRHNPAWHVFDSLRVFASDIKKGCDSKFTEDHLPTHYIAVLPQRLSDAPKYNGETRIDNSNDAPVINSARFGTTTL